ncbi:hypothetical protein DLREEDagrD3_16620 [Denitratisoma sp. agr-D3]
MTVERIVIAPLAGAAALFPAVVTVEAGRGIVGDRHYCREGAEPGQNLTLIEAEAVDTFNRSLGTGYGPADMRRNLIIRGVRLNDLVGRRFVVGGVLLRGVELCEPCAHLGERLATTALSAAAIVAALVGRGGLRADVLRGGEIRPGDALRILD